MQFTQKLKSRKFLLVVAAFVVGAGATLFGVDLDSDLVYGYVVLALGFIGVEGLADNSSRKLDGSFSVKMLQAQLTDLANAELERANFDIGGTITTPDSATGPTGPYDPGRSPLIPSQDGS